MNYSGYGVMLRELRKSCAEIARRTVQQPIEVIQEKSNKQLSTSKGGAKMGKYSDFWRNLLPGIKKN